MSLAQCPGFLFAHREECTVEIKKIINPRYTESGAVDCDVFLTTGTRQFPAQPPLMMSHRRVSKSGRNYKVANGVR